MLETKEKKKSFLITVSLFALLFLMLFFFGLSYLDPATEQGIAINFGTTDVGSGAVQTQKKVKISPKSTAETSEVTSTDNETSKSTTASEEIEKVITQNTEEAPLVKSTKEIKNKQNSKNSDKAVSKDKPVEKKEIKVIEKKPDANTKNILDSFLNGAKQNGDTTTGEGNDTENGDKGKPDGDPKAKAYYGTGKGLDGDGNYRLGGRKALNKERKIPNCNETGIVVVKIIVNQEGKVIQAYPGIKGTTNTAPCLIQPAKTAALATKFNSDSDAPAKQIGSIVYEFKLSE